jgi:hypothetical protein
LPLPAERYTTLAADQTLQQEETLIERRRIYHWNFSTASLGALPVRLRAWPTSSGREPLPLARGRDDPVDRPRAGQVLEFSPRTAPRDRKRLDQARHGAPRFRPQTAAERTRTVSGEFDPDIGASHDRGQSTAIHALYGRNAIDLNRNSWLG